MAAGLATQEVLEVYRDYGHLVRRRCQIVLRDQHLADDALQEVFIKIMRYGAELRGADSKLRWLYRVADHCCFDVLRRQRWGKEAPSAEQGLDRPGPSPGAQFEDRDAVLRLLRQLDDKMRTIAVLAFVDGLSQEEIAKETGWSRQTVNKKLQQIRQRAARLVGRQ